MADEVAFTPKDSYSDLGGTIAIPPDGKTLDVKSRLDSNDGVIVTKNEHEVEALRSFEGLKEVPVPSKRKGGDS